IKGALGEKIRNGKNSAILSKKLATIITTVPIEFHEEDFRLKEWNKDLLKEIFIELEFKTVAKRILGEELSIVPGVVPQGVQTDLFGNAVETKQKSEAGSKKSDATADEDRAEDSEELQAGKNIHNSSHQYRALNEEEAIKKLVEELLEEKEV